MKQLAVRCLEETASVCYALQFSEAVAERIWKQCEPDAVPAVPFCNILPQAPKSVATPCCLQCCSICKSACVQPAHRSSRRFSQADAAALQVHPAPFCPCGCQGDQTVFLHCWPHRGIDGILRAHRVPAAICSSRAAAHNRRSGQSTHAINRHWALPSHTQMYYCTHAVHTDSCCCCRSRSSSGSSSGSSSRISSRSSSRSRKSY